MSVLSPYSEAEALAARAAAETMEDLMFMVSCRVFNEDAGTEMKCEQPTYLNLARIALPGFWAMARIQMRCKVLTGH